MSEPNAEYVCARCGEEIFQRSPDQPWLTVWKVSVDSTQCPDWDAGVVINNGHIPVEVQS